MSLERELGQWNRKSKDFISGLFDRYHDRPGFLTGLAGMLDDPQLQSGATWLLKHHFDEGGEPFEQDLVAAIYRKTPALIHWDARLHILQCMAQMPVPEPEMRTVESFVRHCLTDDARFVRAWAYSGLCELARRFPEFQTEAARVLNEALSHETAGSVLSRVRRELKRGF
ncbi:MAG: hypothetical protein AAFW74_10315 [Pseudomonadota bacterium]